MKETAPADFAHLLPLARTLRPWKPHEALTVNGGALRIVKLEGHFSKFHVHAVDECYVVLEGELLVEIEGQPAQRVSRGDAYVVRAGVSHRPFAVPTAVVLLIDR